MKRINDERAQNEQFGEPPMRIKMHHDNETKMTLPAQVIYVMDKLERAGYTAYAVGGCVRDHLMGRIPGDYDVTTSAKPEEMQKVFAADRVVETGLKHGTLTIVKDGMNVETTTYRIDGTYDDGRHPDSVTFTDRLDDDLCRRDFTINAMAYNPMRGIVDLWEGREDLKKRSIRCVGAANERFSEDGLRILRALRFAAVLDFTPDMECACGVRELKHLLDKISRERIYVELTKLLCGVGASRILAQFPGIIAHVLPHMDEAGVQRAAAYIREDEALVKNGYPKNPALRYALLFSSLDEKQAADAINSLKPSRDEKNAVMSFVKKRSGGVGLDHYSVKCLMRDVNDGFPRDLARYLCVTGQMTADGLHEAERIAEEIISRDQCRRVSQLAVNGQDMMNLGLRGRQIGDTLAALLDAVMAEKAENNAEYLLGLAESLKNE